MSNTEPTPRGNSPADWHLKIEEASRNNVFCHCRSCNREWIASARERCVCGSANVEAIACWQFPDD